VIYTITHRHSKDFSGAVAGEKKTSARGVSHAHPLLCFSFAFTLFLLASFYQKYKKISILYSFYLITSSLLCCFLSTFWRTSQ
jgi:predicted membrane channel-forming protein YqfA (hemolysin III family)